MSGHTLNLLQQEHRELLDLLAVLERQLLSTREGGAPDFEFMAELLDYLQVDPDGHHHRFETRLLRRLRERSPAEGSLDAVLDRRRKEVSSLGHRLQCLVGDVLDGLMVPRRQLATLGLRFVRRYRALVAHEEATVFPALGRALRASDWLELVTACDWQCGRTLPSARQPDYQILNNRLEREAGAAWPQVVNRVERCPVCDGG